MDIAFRAGYDPALAVVKFGKTRNASHTLLSPSIKEGIETRLRRKEEDFVNRIISGKERGHYYLILGPKVLVSLLSMVVFQALRTLPHRCRERERQP